MAVNLLIFIGSILALVKSATFATRYASDFAGNFRLPKYVVGFLVVGVISVMPETLVFANAVIRGVPSFGLGTLFGSNIADFTLIFALVIFFAGRGIKIESKFIQNYGIYHLMILLPLILGADGYYSRLDGMALVVVGLIFYFIIFRKSRSISPPSKKKKKNKRKIYKAFFFLLFSMGALLVSSYFVVSSATELARDLRISPVLIGMLVVGVGTTMPELFFSIKSVRKNNDGLAVGDILGTVLTDVTIIVGLVALISPFYFSSRIIYVTGIFMAISLFALLYLMRSGKVLTKRESYLLLAIYIVFVLVEFAINR